MKSRTKHFYGIATAALAFGLCAQMIAGPFAAAPFALIAWMAYLLGK